MAVILKGEVQQAHLAPDGGVYGGFENEVEDEEADRSDPKADEEIRIFFSQQPARHSLGLLRLD